jgi:cell division protein FtsQ
MPPDDARAEESSGPDAVPTGGRRGPRPPWVDEERRRRLKPWAIGCAVAVALVTGSVALSYTSLLGARVVEVEGEDRLAPRQITRLAQVEAGTNVLHLDEALAEARLEEHPWILDATVRTSLPATITIAVRERTPVLVIVSGSSRRLTAGDGTVLGRASKTSALPEVAVPQGTELGRSELAAAADVVAAMAPALRARADSLTIAPGGDVALVVDGDIDVTYGSVSDVLVKAQALRAILDYSEEEGSGLLSIDLSAPAAPTARFVGSLQPVTVPDPSADVPEPEAGAGDDEGQSEGSSPSP